MKLFYTDIFVLQLPAGHHFPMGKFNIQQGLAERGAMVFEFCRNVDLPIAVTMAGGYARDVEDTADIHYRLLKMQFVC